MSATPTANFNRLARVYLALERLAFGRDLHRVRTGFLSELRERRRILVLGEGDGRCLAEMVRIAPTARFHCIDASAAMLAAASRRLPAEARARVTFTEADLRTVAFDAAPYDAVVTHFILDCFNQPELEAIVQRVRAVLDPEAVWLFGDFAVPPGGFARLRANAWLTILYGFFRWQTGLRVHHLADAPAAISQAGFQRTAAREFQHGLLQTIVFRRIRP